MMDFVVIAVLSLIVMGVTYFRIRDKRNDTDASDGPSGPAKPSPDRPPMTRQK